MTVSRRIGCPRERRSCHGSAGPGRRPGRRPATVSVVSVVRSSSPVSVRRHCQLSPVSEPSGEVQRNTTPPSVRRPVTAGASVGACGSSGSGVVPLGDGVAVGGVGSSSPAVRNRNSPTTSNRAAPVTSQTSRQRSRVVGAGPSDGARGPSTATRGEEPEITVTGFSAVASSVVCAATSWTAGRSDSTAIMVRGKPAWASIRCRDRATSRALAGRCSGCLARHCWSSMSRAGGTSGRWVRGGVECRMRAVSAREVLSPLGIENGDRPTRRFQIVAPSE